MKYRVVPGERPHPDSRLRYVAEAPSVRTRHGVQRRAVCDCDCGVRDTFSVGAVAYGNTRSCGCLHAEGLRSRSTKHGRSKDPMYAAWRGMRARCTASWQRIKPTYLGVRCAPEWATFEGFAANQPRGREFAPGLCLARFDDTGDYSPTNTYWATPSENSRDRVERFARRLPDGRLVVDVAREHGIPVDTAKKRINASGWDPLLAATTPVQTKFRRRNAA